MAGLGKTVAALAGRRRAPNGDHRPDLGRRLQEVCPFGANPGDLRMLLHRPDGLKAKAALVVVLHGCTQTAAGYAGGAGWLTLADRYGFVVLCPEQTRANNANLCFNWFQSSDVARGAGEAASIRGMIARAVGDHDLDPNRVFVTGLSAGGAMANAMLSAYPEVFAAGAIIAGLPYGAAANVQEAFAAMQGRARKRSAQDWGDAVRAAAGSAGRWPRVSIWQGDGDATVRPCVAGDLAAQWIDVHGVHGPGVETGRGGRRLTTWRSADGTAVVELHRIAGMGHGAPLACAADGCGTAGPFLLDVGISSSVELAQSWGLAGGQGDERRVAGHTFGPSERGQQAGWPHGPPSLEHLQRRAPGSDVQRPVGQVIADALRGAGLMK